MKRKNYCEILCKIIKNDHVINIRREKKQEDQKIVENILDKLIFHEKIVRCIIISPYILSN